MKWSEFSSLFPALESRTYLNTAGGGAMSTAASQAGRSYYEQAERLADTAWDAWLERAEAIRSDVAQFIGADSSEVAFLQNASLGLNIVARLFEDPVEVIAPEHEFPSCTTPWMRAGHSVRFVATSADGGVDADDIDRAIGPKTRAVVLSSVHFANGFRADIREIGIRCRKRDVRFIVDATQSICAFDIDVIRDHVDALVFSGYKWATAGYGISVLYLRRPPFTAAPPLVGWRSATSPYLLENDRLDLTDSGVGNEMGHPTFPGIFALGAAVTLFDGTGIDRVSSRIEDLTSGLRDNLGNAGFDFFSSGVSGTTSGITLVRVDGAENWAAELKKRNIWVTARRGGLRVSLHAYNSDAEIGVLQDAMCEITSLLRRH